MHTNLSLDVYESQKRRGLRDRDEEGGEKEWAYVEWGKEWGDREKGGKRMRGKGRLGFVIEKYEATSNGWNGNETGRSETKERGSLMSWQSETGAYEEELVREWGEMRLMEMKKIEEGQIEVN